MTQQAQIERGASCADPGGQVAQLRRVLRLVDEIAGRASGSDGDDGFDEAARFSASYADALPIDQRRFDRLAAETTLWTAVGMKALLALQDKERPTRAAAERLADELDGALERLSLILST